MKSIRIMILAMGILPTLVTATPLESGIGLRDVHSAEVLQPGYLTVGTGTQYYGKVANFGEERDAFTLWTVKGYLTAHWGITPHFEASLVPIIYQDTNRGGKSTGDGEYNLPDDILIAGKLAGFGDPESAVRFGGLFSLRIPTGAVHNLIYEPYSSGRIGIGLQGLLSYFSNRQFHEDGWSLHGNLGYYNHNDVGKKLWRLEKAPKPTGMSQELTVGVGFLYPTGVFDFSMEINARAFIRRPPVSAYSREQSAYLTPAVYYKPRPWLSFEAGMDIRLVNFEDVTDYTFTAAPPTEDFPNYPTWRGVLSVVFTLLPAELRKTSEGELRKQAADRRRILEQMLDEQQDTESAERELQRIQSERKKVEDELERLRRMIEEQQKDQ